MRIFGGDITNGEIDRVVARSFDEHIGRGRDEIDKRDFVANFDAMLGALKKWADLKELSMWKRSRIFAAIEVMLKQDLPKEKVAELVRRARTIIMG